MLNKTTTAPENRRPWSWYRVSAAEEHLLGSMLLRSSTRVGTPEEPGSVLLRSWLLRSRVHDSQERAPPTYPNFAAGGAFPCVAKLTVGSLCLSAFKKSRGGTPAS